MYAGVPMIAPVCVRSDAPRFAMPKSITFGSPHPLAVGAGASSRTLCGLRSRWTMPWSCAACTPPAIFITNSAAARGSILPAVRNRSTRLPPSRHSIAMYGWPSDSPTSYTWMTCGWRMAATASPSARKRSNSRESA